MRKNILPKSNCVLVCMLLLFLNSGAKVGQQRYKIVTAG